MSTQALAFGPHVQAYITEQIAAGETDPETIIRNAVSHANARIVELLRLIQHRQDGTGNCIKSPARRAIVETIAARVHAAAKTAPVSKERM